MDRRVFYSTMLGCICAFTLAALAIRLSGIRSLGAQPAASWQGRQYCLSKTLATGKQALTACPVGFHMANMAEIVNPSALMYATAAGYTLPDSGSGPPFSIEGWVRTGLYAWPQVNSPTAGDGVANCNLWTSDASMMSGSSVYLAPEWASNSAKSTTGVVVFQNFLSYPSLIAPWVSPYSISTTPNQSLPYAACSVPRRVWCVQD
jgi:hypothetical protein